MDITILITLILILVFFINYILYWILFLKTEMKITKAWDIYTKIYIGIWATPVISIPIITSSFITEISVFQLLWPGFLAIGIIFVVLGVKIGKMALEANKVRGLAKGNYRLKTESPYNIMRHPMYAAWALVFFGLALILDSIIALIITPFFMLFLEFEGYLEEKYLLLPKFGEKYEDYKEKVPCRLFPSPYNGLLIIIAILIVYVGYLNLYA